MYVYLTALTKVLCLAIYFTKMRNNGKQVSTINIKDPFDIMYHYFFNYMGNIWGNIMGSQ